MTERGQGRVLVVGSLNQDLSVTVRSIPRPGETVPGGNPRYGCGGKGANQAVAAARAGARVRMVGCVGRDSTGERLLAQLQNDGIDVTTVQRVASPSGLAVVTVAEDGENTVIVTAGANGVCTPEVVAKGLADLTPADVVVTQAEIPAASIVAAAEQAHRAGARFVLNLAPPIRIDLESLHLTALVVNEHELAALAAGTQVSDRHGSSEQPDPVAQRLASSLGATVVVTLGGNGVLVANSDDSDDSDDHHVRLPAYPPERVVDTTGAGDAFVGALAAALAQGHDVMTGARWGAAAGSIAVAAPGAQPEGLTPTRLEEVLGASFQ